MTLFPENTLFPTLCAALGVSVEDFEQRSGRQAVGWGGENSSEELWVKGGDRNSSGW